MTPAVALGRLETVPVQSFISNYGYFALFLLTVAESACIPIPSEVTLAYAGYLASTGRLEVAAVIVVATAGSLVGSYLGYAIGRFGGRPLVDRIGKYALLTQSDINRSEHWFAKHGEPAVFFGRVIPVIRTFISLPAGWAEMSLGRFSVATLAGSAIWCTALTLIGYEVGGTWDKATKGFSWAGYVAAAIVAVAFVAFIIHRYTVVRRERHQES